MNKYKSILKLSALSFTGLDKYGDNDIKRVKKNTFFSLLIESLSDSRKRNLLLNLRHIITSGIQEDLLRIPINGSLNLFEGTF